MSISQKKEAKNDAETVTLSAVEGINITLPVFREHIKSRFLIDNKQMRISGLFVKLKTVSEESNRRVVRVVKAAFSQKREMPFKKINAAAVGLKTAFTENTKKFTAVIKTAAQRKGRTSFKDLNGTAGQADNEKKDSKPRKPKEKRKGGISNISAGRLIIGAAALMLALILLWAFTHKNAQEVSVDGAAVGIIKDTKISAEDLYEAAIAKIRSEQGTNIEVNEELTVKPVHASSKEIVSTDYLLSEISKKFTFKVEAYVINVDGKEIATLKSQEEAQNVLDSIAKQYVSEQAALVDKSFVQNVEIKDKYVSEDEVVPTEKAFLTLTATTNAQKTYTVASGDTLFGIAINADMSLEELMQANPQLTENSIIKEGDVISLVVPVPMLSVRTVEKVTYTAAEPAPVETVENNNEYKTYRKVLQEGKDGEKEVVANIVKLNGIEEERTVVSETITVQPVTQRVEVGTLQTPPKRALGSFIYPVSGRFSSGFGSRWGTVHQGIDLAAPRGTRVYASDGGTVTFAGYNSGGYGYLVIIDHGNGYVTYYGHNSELAVQAGQDVAQGELVSYVGSTGNSTGNHLHFEVRKNGVPQNPLNYLK